MKFYSWLIFCYLLVSSQEAYSQNSCETPFCESITVSYLKKYFAKSNGNSKKLLFCEEHIKELKREVEKDSILYAKIIDSGFIERSRCQIEFYEAVNSQSFGYYSNDTIFIDLKANQNLELLSSCILYLNYLGELCPAQTTYSDNPLSEHENELKQHFSTRDQDLLQREYAVVDNPNECVDSEELASQILCLTINHCLITLDNRDKNFVGCFK